jgi:hypothetical protein
MFYSSIFLPSAGILEFRRAYAKPSDGFADSPEIDQGPVGRSSDRTECSSATEQSVIFPGYSRRGRWLGAADEIAEGIAGW